MLGELKQKVSDFSVVLDKFPEVRYAGDPLLRQAADKVTIEDGRKIGEKLGEVLMRYRREVGYGRGFAAPQIGECKSVFVTFVDDALTTFINPQITKRSAGTNFYRELCLSSGIMATDVERSEWIVMEWFDTSGTKQSGRFNDFLARLYQHEEAHFGVSLTWMRL